MTSTRPRDRADDVAHRVCLPQFMAGGSTCGAASGVLDEADPTLISVTVIGSGSEPSEREAATLPFIAVVAVTTVPFGPLVAADAVAVAVSAPPP